MGNKQIKKDNTRNHYNFLKELENSDPEFLKSQINNNFKFFWLSNSDPDKEEDLQKWTPYEEDDNLYIEYCYQQFKKGNKIITEIGDYRIDFVKWYQYHKDEKWRQRRVIRENPKYLDLVFRKSRHITMITLITTIRLKSKRFYIIIR